MVVVATGLLSGSPWLRGLKRYVMTLSHANAKRRLEMTRRKKQKAKISPTQVRNATTLGNINITIMQFKPIE